MSIHKTKDGRWFCKFWEDGRYHKKYFGRGKEGEIAAQDYDLSVKRMKLKGVKVIKKVESAKREELRFDQLAQLYLDDKQNGGWPEKSIYNFKHFMNRYVIPCIGHKICQKIDMSDLITLRGYIPKKSLKGDISPHSINRYVTMTKAVFSWGANNDFIPFNPWSKYKTPRENTNPPHLLTVDELIRVMDCAAPHCRWALDVEFNTGCRPGKTELFKLKYTDVIDWEEGKLLIRSTKTKPRVVELRPDFLKRLKAKYSEAKTDYIVEYKGKPLNSLRWSLKTALKRAGIKKKVRPYDIRHMYGTYMAKNGADIFAIQILMGHSSITTTKRYLHHAEELKRDAIRRLPSLVPSSQNEGAKRENLVPKISPQNEKWISGHRLTH